MPNVRLLICSVGYRPPQLAGLFHIEHRHVSKCMRRPVKQFELSGQHSDTQIRLGAREVGLKSVQLVSGFRQSLERCSLLGRHWRVGGHRVQFFNSSTDHGGGKRRAGIGVLFTTDVPT